MIFSFHLVLKVLILLERAFSNLVTPRASQPCVITQLKKEKVIQLDADHHDVHNLHYNYSDKQNMEKSFSRSFEMLGNKNDIEEDVTKDNGLNGKDSKCGSSNLNDGEVLMYKEAQEMLGDMEDWVEGLMDVGDEMSLFQARILIDKAFEGRFLVGRAWSLGDGEEMEHVHGVIRRVWKVYDPNGNLVQHVNETVGMLDYLRGEVMQAMDTEKDRNVLRSKLEEGYYLIDQALTKRDERQVMYIWKIVKNLFTLHQVQYAPYREPGVYKKKMIVVKTGKNKLVW